MPKSKTIYICQECAYESAKWLGKCPSCSAWNSMVEEVKAPEEKSKTPPSRRIMPLSSDSAGGIAAGIYPLHELTAGKELRIDTGMAELNRVLGGGIVIGSLVLVGGDPGIGKSTLLLQICGKLGDKNRLLYISGEESQRQIKLRADRLKVKSENLYVMTETDVHSIASAIHSEKPDFVVIDSIQTMYNNALNSSPGSVTQVRECTAIFMNLAKELGTPIFLVSHVNKEGVIAGPKVMEHMVDTVLYFEGDKQHTYRMLRTMKNRFGANNEIGVFEMSEYGLVEVENPSMALLSGRPKNISGTCVTCVMEGSRPILAEVQALVAQTTFGNPRRMASGLDYNRMHLLIAVLERRAGLFMSNSDAYVNVVGGLHLDEPASDLSIILALASGIKNITLGDDLVAIGEVGLAGEVRNVNSIEHRISECTRLGFKKCIIPRRSVLGPSFSDSVVQSSEIQLIRVGHILQAFDAVFGS